jgi:hypothetical protein
VRPHTRPDDISFAIHAINWWAVETYRDRAFVEDSTDSHSLLQIGEAFRTAAYKQWWHLLWLPMRYTTLPEQEHRAVTWSHLVTLWQVIGRLVRGGSPARVYFCDAAFIPEQWAGKASSERRDSLLLSMRRVLRPYFERMPEMQVTTEERELVQTLYGPLYEALKSMKGLPEDV